jgi:exopolyphosphatase/guanosine-5'-triphosphate,3'-diphosphate pyrophosphatase
MRVAVIDLGSNSTRLLVADVQDGSLEEIERRSTVTRLAQGVDGSGLLKEEAMARVFATLDEYRAAIDSHGTDAAVAVMTSAVRDAANGQEFAARVGADYDLEARILTGDDEAGLTFAGATSERPPKDDRTRVVIDIGGGSTELVVGTGHTMRFHASTQAGVVRQTERHLHHDPPDSGELQSLSTEVGTIFADAIPKDVVAGVDGAIAVAGTATSCAALALRLDPYDASRVEGYELTLGEVEMLIARLAAMDEAERREQPGLHPDRAATIVAGTVLLAQAMRVFGLQRVEVSEHDLLRGAALERAAA